MNTLLLLLIPFHNRIKEIFFQGCQTRYCHILLFFLIFAFLIFCLKNNHAKVAEMTRTYDRFENIC